LETVFYEETTDSPIIESAVVKPLRQAYVFINTESESNESAIEDLQKIECISEIYPAKGAYDIVAKVSGESIDYLREQIFRRIKNLPTIKSTLTLMIVDPLK
jgi:DNA-binding Lrp family transcriptional regulator